MRLDPSRIGHPVACGAIAAAITVAALAALALGERATRPTIAPPVPPIASADVSVDFRVTSSTPQRIDAPVQPIDSAYTVASEPMGIWSVLTRDGDLEATEATTLKELIEEVRRRNADACAPSDTESGWKLDGDVLSYDGYVIRVLASREP